MEDTYWQEHISLFTGIFDYYRKKPQAVRAKIHTSQEQYDNSLLHELVPVDPRRGERTYVMMHPYVEEPNIVLTVGIPHNGYADTNTIGTVQDTRVEGLRHMQAGSIQAWYYQDSKTLILWECFFERNFRGNTPLGEDTNMRQLWQHTEQALHAKFPPAEKIVTPFSDPLFETKDYQIFLRSLGYEPVAEAAFGKWL